MQKHISPQLPILIRHRIMQRMRSDIPPVPIQAHLQRRSPSPRHLEHAIADSQRGIGAKHLDAGHPFRDLSSLLGCQGRPVRRMACIESGELVACSVG